MVPTKKGGGAELGESLPNRHEVRHGIRIVLKVRLLADRDSRRILAAREDVFLAPGWVDVRVLMLLALVLVVAARVLLCAF